MRWPWVSRRAYELLEKQFEQLQGDYREQQSRADRSMDQLIQRFGYEPVSAPVRKEVQDAVAKVESAMDMLYEDPTSGTIDESVLEMASRLGSDPA